MAEIYSPPRVTAWASTMRLVPGLAMALTRNDPDDGMPWDFNNPEKAAKAKRKATSSNREPDVRGVPPNEQHQLQ